MTAQQLKNSILQMAVQGKLVPQDPNDEPASVLLERIRKEKEQLIKEGKIKREKNPSVIFRGAYNTPYEKVGNAEPVSIADEVPFEIPESWEWCRLADLTVKEVKRGKSPTYIASSGTLVFAQKCNVKTGGIDMSLAKFLDEKTLGKYPAEEFMQDQDIVVNSTGTGTMGRIGLFHDSDNPKGLPIVPDSHVAVVRLNHDISVEYLVCCLQYYQPYLEEHGEGSTNQKELKPDTIKNLLIPLPPTAEQIRIAHLILDLEQHVLAYGKKESQLAMLNRDFPEQLKKSILQIAVQGKLVPQDPSDEPASVLLERIRAEKERLIKEGKIKRDKNESVILRRDNSHYEKLGSEEHCIDDEIPYDIPDSWIWCRIGNLFSLQAGKNVPSSEIKELEFKGSYPCFGGNGKRGYVSCYNHEGDYPLIGRQGALCGNINRATGRFYATEHAVCVEAFADTNISWACLFLKALDLNQYATATAQPGLAVANINKVLIPLPPLSEQLRIVERIESLLTIIDSL